MSYRTSRPIVLFSITPYHAGRIYRGSKPFEFRRRRVRILPGAIAYIYETSPECVVSGEFVVMSVVTGEIETLALLEPCADERPTVLRYLRGASRPCALQIGGVARWKVSKSLKELGLSRPPQSYSFIADRG